MYIHFLRQRKEREEMHCPQISWENKLTTGIDSINSICAFMMPTIANQQWGTYDFGKCLKGKRIPHLPIAGHLLYYKW
jgi:hypothetical protein